VIQGLAVRDWLFSLKPTDPISRFEQYEQYVEDRVFALSFLFASPGSSGIVFDLNGVHFNILAK